MSVVSAPGLGSIKDAALLEETSPCLVSCCTSLALGVTTADSDAMDRLDDGASLSGAARWWDAAEEALLSEGGFGAAAYTSRRRSKFVL